MTYRSGVALAIALATGGCGDNLPPPCTGWSQWGGDGEHSGTACAAGQPLTRIITKLVFDPFTEQEQLDAGGGLVIHYQVPLLEDDDVYMVAKGGAYTPCPDGPDGPDCSLADQYRANSQIWSEVAYRWVDGQLASQWSFPSDWKPEPGLGFEPAFQPALAGDVLAVPGAGGSVWELDRLTGATVRHDLPFGPTVDPDVYVSGGIAVGPDRTLYYNALRLDHDQPWSSDAQGWLVAVAPDGTTRTVDYATVMPLAADAMCHGTFDVMTTPRPWPPAPQPDGSPTLPPLAPCGAQRPGVNITPAIGADGTIFVVTRAQFASRYSFVAALAPDLDVKWTRSLRDVLADACGVLIPADATDTSPPGMMFDCRVGSITGVDPSTNQLPAGQVSDSSSSSPVALPDGGVVYGAFTGYNTFRGHLFALDADGAPRATYDFGWDTTPAVVQTERGYELMIKDNMYLVDSMGVDLGPYFMARLTSDLTRRWTYRNTETMSCILDAQGQRVCIEDHPNGFEWCINALAVDAGGVTFANAEDGYVYAIGPDGALRDRLFLDESLGAAYTPLAIDRTGRIYALNNGKLAVVGE